MMINQTLLLSNRCCRRQEISKRSMFKHRIDTWRVRAVILRRILRRWERIAALIALTEEGSGPRWRPEVPGVEGQGWKSSDLMEILSE